MYFENTKAFLSMNPPEDSKSCDCEHLWMKEAYTKELLSELQKVRTKERRKAIRVFSCFFQLPGEIFWMKPLIQLKGLSRKIFTPETKIFFQKRVILDSSAIQI